MVDFVANAVEHRLEELCRPVKGRLSRLFKDHGGPDEVYGLLSEFLSVEGKLLRPALCLLSCRAVGGKDEQAVPAATAIEMFHNFTLIHDDIEDCSKMRRGKPCMHVKYGLPLALNAGDGLFMMVWRETLSIDGDRREEAQKKLLSAFTRVLEGQAVELGWYQKGKWDIGKKEYYDVVGGKTGALIAVSCEVGGFLGGADEKTCNALYEFGLGLGVGFQIIDDTLNIIGDEKKYGKEIGGDVAEGKRTLLTLEAVHSLPLPKRKRLGVILKQERKTEADIAEAVALLKESGAADKVIAEADGEISRALGKLSALPDSAAKEDLLMLAKYITKRER